MPRKHRISSTKADVTLPARGLRRPYSKLYCRVNGFMFGVFLQMSKFKLARRKYRFFRGRMQHFLMEVGIPAQIPPKHKDFDAWCVAQVPRLLELLGERPYALVDYFGIGFCAVQYILKRLRDRAEAERARHAAHILLARQKLPVEGFDALVDVSGQPARSVAEIVSPALRLAMTFLRDLPPEPKTCFVAMPFREPYEGYFAAYYQPLLAAVGYRCIRAWGGFGREDFSPPLVAMIMKSGALLADVTEPNPNVLWEVGVAQGAGKRVFLVHDERREPPADLGNHLALRYRPRGHGWAAKAVQEQPLAFYMLAASMEGHRRDAIGKVSGIRGGDVDSTSQTLFEVLEEAATSTEVSETDRHLAQGSERLTQSRWLDAESDFDYVLEHGGNIGEASYGRGIARQSQQRFAEAETDLSNAIRAHIPNDSAYYFRASGRVALGRYRAALRDLDRLLARDSQRLEAIQLRTLIHARLGNIRAAERDGSVARRLAPRESWTYGPLGMIRLARGEFGQAIELLRTARRRSSGTEWGFELALARLLSGDFTAGIRDYVKALIRASDPEIDDALRELSYWSRKHNVTGRPAFRDAISRVRKQLRAVRDASSSDTDAASVVGPARPSLD